MEEMWLRKIKLNYRSFNWWWYIYIIFWEWINDDIYIIFWEWINDDMYISIPKNSKIKSNVELHKLINIDIGRIKKNYTRKGLKQPPDR